MDWEQLAKPKPIYPGTPLATRILQSPLWVAQMKVDGMRVMVDVGRAKTTLTSRHGKNVLLASDAAMAVTSGIPAMSLCDAEWEERFRLLWIFDVMRIAGQDIASQPLSERLMRLNSAIVPNKHLRIVPTIRERKECYYNAVIEVGGEGVVLKRLADQYPRGGVVWLKLKPVRS